jgi:hypothetical protein
MEESHPNSPRCHLSFDAAICPEYSFSNSVIV